MDRSSKIDIVCHAIIRQLEQGIDLGPMDWEMIDSLLGNPDVNELKQILEQSEDAEAQSLIAYFCLPGEAMQMSLEQILESQACSPEDEALIQMRFLKSKPKIIIRDLPSHEQMTVTIPEDLCWSLIANLHISKNLDKRMIALIEKRFEPNYQLMVKVRLRNRRFELFEDNISLLLRFIDQMGQDTPEFYKGLELILEWLNEAGSNTDYFDLFYQKKLLFSDMLEKSRYFQKQIEKFNMETLMMRGERYITINETEIKYLINIVDQICLTCFGRTPYQPKDMISINIERSMKTEDMIRLLDEKIS